MADSAAPPVPTPPAAVAAPSTFARRLVEDAAQAREHLVLTALLGSPLLPRIVRRALLTAAGSRAGSGPGAGFSLTGNPRLLTIGRGVFFNRGVTVEAVAPVTIGANTAIGMQALIMTSHHDIDAEGRWSDVATGRPVVIEEHVWIGGRATILPGAHIEHDVVVAAGAVVAGRLLAHGVYAGVPAKRIRELAPTARPAASDVTV
ncbi:DapH/DapD/GlmU-related protein [Curtobacterium sp. VKM Ac-1376]|uniref:DapH/DapD/GlmU-related protein n=1 Tax=Curtobacterium sp. VKM Ac-1376 TaxID=123312 RepID=UPI00188C762D|nr:DapH/DapD/GlmU-related protein [Curtobacterium sp. VKM Ac-1376]MBF4615713.1 acyltransferase [Curtobacterium sp. VKM Ac-1376]